MLRGGSGFCLRFLLRHDRWSVREHANTLWRGHSLRLCSGQAPSAKAGFENKRRALAKKQVVFAVKPPQFLGHLHGHAHAIPKQGIDRLGPEHLAPEHLAEVA